MVVLADEDLDGCVADIGGEFFGTGGVVSVSEVLKENGSVLCFSFAFPMGDVNTFSILGPILSRLLVGEMLCDLRIGAFFLVGFLLDLCFLGLVFVFGVSLPAVFVSFANLGHCVGEL